MFNATIINLVNLFVIFNSCKIIGENIAFKINHLPSFVNIFQKQSILAAISHNVPAVWRPLMRQSESGNGAQRNDLANRKPEPPNWRRSINRPVRRISTFLFKSYCFFFNGKIIYFIIFPIIST
jgi:hypothetical protein